MRYFIALFLLSISTFSSGQTELLDAKKIWARDSIRLGTNWIRSISKDTALLTVTDRDIPSAKAVKDFVLNRWNNGLVPWDNITGKPSLLISGNNLADVSNVATARTNLSVYSIATVNDSLLNHYTKSQADARFKGIDWFPSVSNVTGLPDSLTNLQSRIQTKLTKSDADSYYPAIQRMQDSLAAVQARVQTKEPFIIAGTSAQYWRGDKSWQTLDKYAVGLSAVPNVDATNPANITQSATYRFVTDSEKSTWNAKQNALGYTAENAANKATDFSTVNNTLYPTVQAVSNAISTATSSYIPLSQKGANNGVATLDVGGKVPFSQLPAALMIYKGTWNVSTNTPTLSDGTGVTGWVYIVSVGGTVNTGSGNIYYSAGDYAIHNGSTWEKSAGTNNVASVNGQQGVVNLTTANISESGNLYYLDARARAALSFSPGSGGYNSSTGVITIPTNTNQLTNGAGFITGYTETDPTIYAWAKAATKPSYSYSEITSTPTTWAWSNITGIPTTFTPSAHSHGNADITDVAWAKITGAPAFITSSALSDYVDVITPQSIGGAKTFTSALTNTFTSGGYSTFATNDGTAANNAGGGFYNVASATPSSRLAAIWLDADGGNFSGSDYGIIEKLGNGGKVRIMNFNSSGIAFGTAATEYVNINGTSGALSGTSLSMSGAITGASLNTSTSSNVVGSINSTNATGGYMTWATNGTTIADIGTATQVFGSGGSEVFAINGRGARDIAFGTNNTMRVLISSNGKVGVGATTATGKVSSVASGIPNSPTNAAFWASHSVNSATDGLSIGDVGVSSYKYIQSFNSFLAINPVGNNLVVGGTTDNGIDIGQFNGSVLASGRVRIGGGFITDAVGGNNIGIVFGSSGLLSSDGSVNLTPKNFGTTTNRWAAINAQTGDFSSTVTATGFIKSGSSDSYFLLGGGGHVLASSYATTSSLSGYVDISSNQYEIGGNKTFLADVVVNGKLTGARILGSTASYTTTATISSTITTAFCSGSSYTLTLPSASGVTGQILTVISNSSLTGITLSGVEGGSYTLICNSSLVLVSNGTTWKIASVYQNAAACS